MNTEHYRKLEHMFLNGATLNREIFTNPTIEVGEAEASISLPIRPAYHHAAGAIHGSVYFKMLDDAAYFATASLVEDVFVVTTQYSISLLRPVSEGVITAKGKVGFRSRSLWVADAELFDERGKLIGKGTGHFMKSAVPLSAELGYC